MKCLRGTNLLIIGPGQYYQKCTLRIVPLLGNNKHMRHSSYFSRHKQALTSTKNKSQKPNPNSSNLHSSMRNNSYEGDDYKVQESIIEKHKLASLDAQPELDEERTEEKKIYEEYKQIKAKYEQELKDIDAEIERIKREAEEEDRKVRQAEIALEAKKRELAATKQRYEEMLMEYGKEEHHEVEENKIGKLQAELAQIEEKNNEKIRLLQEEEQKIRQENSQLALKLAQLEQQYKKTLQFDHSEYQKQKVKLQQQERCLREELESLQSEGDKIKKDIQQIQDMKPVSGEVHKKYLDLYERMFISQQLAKAEKIMGFKQQQRKYSIELGRRKQWLKQKQKQIQQRQMRIAEKNKLLDKLTMQIREKSTLLLTKYQVESEKHKK